MPATVLDLTGLKCPLPALLTRKALLRLVPGERLEVHCTDPMTAIDIPAMVQQQGGTIENSARNGEVLIFLIAKCNGTIENSD